jgi:hypothetical protein
MRRLFAVLVTALVVLAGNVVAIRPLDASPQEMYGAPHYGAGNLPPGCIHNASLANLANTCYHMKAALNALDSPKVDILILVPASPTAERDARIIRQSVEMWDAGIHYLAPQMGLGWLADGVEFRISVDVMDPTSATSNIPRAVNTFVDPEIVLVATNPGAGAGIGIDPVKTATDGTFLSEDLVPCFNVPSLFSYGYWKGLPGFETMKGGGTYEEDCNGSGGNTCFAILGGIDPAPSTTDAPLGLFDVMAHEFGHCLSLGHVGDGADGHYGPVAYNDIMSYSLQPAGIHKCVSTLDVETFAIRMSHYLDVNGDGVIDQNDWLSPNDPAGINDNLPAQVQSPRDYFFASSTGSPLDCPQPDVGLLPGPKTQWTPTPVDATQQTLTVSSPGDGAVVGQTTDVSGTVERHTPFDPPGYTASAVDPTGDASSPYTDILGVSTEATPTDLHITMHLADMVPTAPTASPVVYAAWVGPVEFVSFIQAGSLTLYPRVTGTTTWDTAAKTVEFHLPYEDLRLFGVRAPYVVNTSADVGTNSEHVNGDWAPNGGQALTVGKHPAACGGPCPDGDGDGVADPDDACPTVAGDGANGCVVGVTEHVHVFLDGAEVGSQAVDTFNRSTTASFDVPITVPSGTHTVRVDWEDRGKLLGTKTVTVTSH